MTEKQISEAVGKLGRSCKGDLRNLFYLRNGLPRQALYTNLQIFEQLGIMEYDPNSLEMEGLQRILTKSLAGLRKQAKDAGLAWIDVEISRSGPRIARHGFSRDIDKIMLNADKFETLADQRIAIAEQTREIADTQKKLLESA